MLREIGVAGPEQDEPANGDVVQLGEVQHVPARYSSMESPHYVPGG